MPWQVLFSATKIIKNKIRLLHWVHISTLWVWLGIRCPTGCDLASIETSHRNKRNITYINNISCPFTYAYEPSISMFMHSCIYRKISNISRTKSQNLNVSCLVFKLSLPHPLKQPGVKSRMKMQLEQRRQAMLQLHLSDQQIYCLLRCISYYRFDGSQIVASGKPVMENFDLGSLHKYHNLGMMRCLIFLTVCS